MAIFIYPPNQVTIAGAATEATLLQVETNTAATATELQTLNAAVATEATLTLVKDNTENTANSVSNIETYTNQSSDTLSQRLAGSLVPAAFDHIDLSYVPSGNGVGEVQTAVYKVGGPSGTTVATLTLSYDGSNRLASVTKS